MWRIHERVTKLEKKWLKMNTFVENFNILWNGILRAEPKEIGRIYCNLSSLPTKFGMCIALCIFLKFWQVWDSWNGYKLSKLGIFFICNYKLSSLPNNNRFSYWILDSFCSKCTNFLTDFIEIRLLFKNGLVGWVTPVT